MLKIPETKIDFKEILCSDTISDIVMAYNKFRKTINGKTISDIAQVFCQLKSWINIEEAELIIPFKFSKQRKEPFGHRIWYLSRKIQSKYYFGQLFDLQVTITSKRIIRKKCKLSIEAVKFFEKYPQVIKNERIDNDC